MPLSNKKAALAAEQQNLSSTGATHAGAAPPANTNMNMNNPNANANLPGPAPFTAGPHRHDIMNKLDPTVDSGTGGMQVLASNAHTNNNAATGISGMPGQPAAAGGMTTTGLGSNNPYNNTSSSTTAPPHNSRLANALDPRVDSTQPSSTNYYTKGTNVVPGAGATPRHVPEGTYGPHSSRMANAADPRVDSDADRHRMGGVGAGSVGGAAAGSAPNVKPIYPPGVGGPAPTTAGPHRHDILNKLDPTVDSRKVANVDSTGHRVV
ncbi:uncharacterized protein TRIREDRAFT_121439 [Trichoderma reesei QM6a]|uniref:Predicted protein n=2 Tax=Hypocrea jecorina TaxID=51453 RepID=G0RHM7_HYPJQ|nr:uncharacterized protein TRIREDRAFT_121439 [Trichoderma reesei QM6a]EGR49612.1 predicted protein [Trichoderma reesei QM6a]ETS02863.1 hypothetical protein M419DRAFT_97811 [Trichoderma reesei RUT C-30]